jgi:hypothetical protein
MSQSPITLKLTDKALERLFEGEDGQQFKVDLAEAVIQNFAGKYLKGCVTRVAMEEAKNKAIDAAKSCVADYVTREFGSTTGGWRDQVTTLKPAFVRKIQTTVDNTFMEYMKDYSANAAVRFAEQAEARLASALDAKLSTVITGKLNETFLDPELNKWIDAEVNRRIREKLGL